jgi:hypothetical protein
MHLKRGPLDYSLTTHVLQQNKRQEGGAVGDSFVLRKLCYFEQSLKIILLERSPPEAQKAIMSFSLAFLPIIQRMDKTERERKMTFEERLNELIEIARKEKFVIEKWRVQAEWLLIQYLGRDHYFTEAFMTRVAAADAKDDYDNCDPSFVGWAILTALKEDYGRGHLKIQELE